MRDVRWDLVIVDEAHKMAAYRYGAKVTTTQRYDLGAFLRDRTDHYLFLTATPHKGDPENFALLLQLLDQDLYVTGKILEEASQHDENRIMIRRLKENMKKFDGSPCFPPRPRPDPQLRPESWTSCRCTIRSLTTSRTTSSGPRMPRTVTSAWP